MTKYNTCKVIKCEEEVFKEGYCLKHFKDLQKARSFNKKWEEEHEDEEYEEDEDEE